MSSGAKVNPDCQMSFQKMAEGKKEFRYIIFKIEDNEIVVEKNIRNSEMATADSDDYADNSKAAYEEFLKDIKDVTDNFQDCRYAVFDFKFTCNREGAGISKMDKILFLQICPDSSPVKRKMVYASSASAIKQALGTGKILHFQISDESEINHHEIHKTLIAKYFDKKA